MVIDKRGTRLDFILRAGSKFNQSFVMKTKSDGEPMDMSVFDEIHFQVRLKTNSPVIMEGKLSDNTITISGDDNNIVTIVGVEVPETVGNFKYEIDFISGVTSNDSFFYGVIKIVDEITKEV